jgi:ribosome-associated protein
MEESEHLSTENKCELIIEAILEKKGHQVVTIDLTGIENSICDIFIICHGESVTQVDAISESIERKVKQKGGVLAHHVEGRQNRQWILMDYYDVLVHVFLEEYRSFYKLEELWADADILYSGEEDEEDEESGAAPESALPDTPGE